MLVSLVVLVSLLLCFAAATKTVEHRKRFLGWTPTQIHLSLTDNVDEMLVTFVTWWEGSVTEVHYQQAGESHVQVVKGHTTTFKDSTSQIHTIRYIHRAVMSNLTQGATYTYWVQDRTYVGTSDKYEFVALQRDAAKPMTFAVCKPAVVFYAVFSLATYSSYDLDGDFGYINAQSLPLLNDMDASGAYDVVLHNGE
jgi:hypothetical protein